LHETLDTQLRFSCAYHPQTDGQTERVNQILEDMLSACALECKRSWDKSLPYVEFSYDNSYQESSKMAPFEMLYGHRFRIPLFWSETGERKIFEPNILQEAEKPTYSNFPRAACFSFPSHLPFPRQLNRTVALPLPF
jgi:hypothetical protein